MITETNRQSGDGSQGGLVGIWRKAKGRYASHPRPRRRYRWIGYGLASINAVAIAFFVFDAPMGQTAKDLPAQLISIAGAVTDVGRLVSLAVAVCAILAVCLSLFARLSDVRRRFRLIYLCQTAIYLLVSLLSASALVNALKYIIGRVRPPLYEYYGILGFDPFNGEYLFKSFPSAHSANVGALFVALALQFPRFRLLFMSLALWLGMTRVIVGAHYPSDVVAGLILGAWCAFAVAVLFARFGWVFMTTSNTWPRPRIARLGMLGRSTK